MAEQWHPTPFQRKKDRRMLQVLHKRITPASIRIVGFYRTIDYENKINFKTALKITDETPADIKMKVDWSLDISTAIDEALHRKRMTQKELAARLGTSPASVHSWLGGTHNFTLSTLARISAVLGVPLISVPK